MAGSIVTDSLLMNIALYRAMPAPCGWSRATGHSGCPLASSVRSLASCSFQGRQLHDRLNHEGNFVIVIVGEAAFQGGAAVAVGVFVWAGDCVPAGPRAEPEPSVGVVCALGSFSSAKNKNTSHGVRGTHTLFVNHRIIPSGRSRPNAKLNSTKLAPEVANSAFFF